MQTTKMNLIKQLQTLTQTKSPTQRINSMSNEAYKKACETTLNKKIAEINKRYSDAYTQAEKYTVR